MSYKRLFGIGFVFMVASVAWLILGGAMNDRTDRYQWELRDQVAELWGRPQVQQAPRLDFEWETERKVRRTESVDGQKTVVEEVVLDQHSEEQSVRSTDIEAKIGLDQRRKGLIWYSLYDLGFEGAWSYTHDREESGDLLLTFIFPDANGIYDGFHFRINGEERADRLQPRDGRVEARVPVTPGQTVTLEVDYQTRGLDTWSYLPSEGVGNVEAFSMVATTDFTTIDFPSQSLSPSSKSESDSGWVLNWDFERVVTSYGMGVVVPSRIQPGELASEMALSAPVSLLFFFVILFVLATLRDIDIHPINYLFIAASFFAFHLLFAYTVDILPITSAFILCSVVSMTLVVSYMRLVVSSRFAFMETALAQLIYLIGFSLAHFSGSYTGLTVTILSILTLFLLMQLTGRLKWTDVLSSNTKVAPTHPVPSPA